MNHIDKSINGSAGISVAQATLDNRWDSATGQYKSPLDYDHCDHDTIRNRLLQDQYDANVGAPVCCYCMRRLYHRVEGERDNVTIEHIIPKGINQNQWNNENAQYREFPELASNNVDVCLGGSYTRISTKINGLPHPHFMSYHNMVASCDGGLMLDDSLKKNQCCNNRRGDKLVLPMYFSTNIQQEIEYKGDGDIELNDNDSNYRISWFYHLNLLCSELKKMRRFWYLVSSQTEYTAKDVEHAVTDQDVRDEIQTKFGRIDGTEWQALGNVNYLKWLSSYCWFYYYFKNKSSRTNIIQTLPPIADNVATIE